jgi:MFS family permease
MLRSNSGADRYRWYVLALLLAIYMIHHLDRQVVSLLLVPIGAEFALSDSQLGLLAGTVYAIAFAVAGIPLGLLVDRVHRVRLLSLLIALWSGLTALCAMANTFLTLVLMRIGIGAAESGGTPTNLSLLSDYFERARRSTAVGIYMMGPQLGTIVGFALAGVIAAKFGWRAAFLAAGIPGTVLAIIVFMTVREPKRGAGDLNTAAQASEAPAPPVVQALRRIAAEPALVHLIIGLTIANTVAAGVSVWLPALLMRVHGVSIQTAGLSVAFGIATFAALASLCSGMVSDRIGAESPHAVPRLAAFAALITIPCIVLGAMTAFYWVVIAAFAAQTAAHAVVNTPGYAVALSLAPAELRGTTTAVMQVASNLLGYGAGPQLIGMLSDAFKASSGADSLRYGLAIFVFVNLWAVAHLLRAAYWMRRGVGAETSAPAARATPRIAR